MAAINSLAFPGLFSSNSPISPLHPCLGIFPSRKSPILHQLPNKDAVSCSAGRWPEHRRLRPAAARILLPKQYSGGMLLQEKDNARVYHPVFKTRAAAKPAVFDYQEAGNGKPPANLFIGFQPLSPLKPAASQTA